MQVVFPLRSCSFTLDIFSANLESQFPSQYLDELTVDREESKFLNLFTIWKKKILNGCRKFPFVLPSKEKKNYNMQRNILSLKTSQPCKADLPVKCKKKKKKSS